MSFSCYRFHYNLISCSYLTRKQTAQVHLLLPFYSSMAADAASAAAPRPATDATVPAAELPAAGAGAGAAPPRQVPAVTAASHMHAEPVPSVAVTVTLPVASVYASVKVSLVPPITWAVTVTGSMVPVTEQSEGSAMVPAMPLYVSVTLPTHLAKLSQSVPCPVAASATKVHSSAEARAIAAKAKMEANNFIV